MYAGLTKNIWPMAEFLVSFSYESLPTTSYSIILPRGFLCNFCHSILFYLPYLDAYFSIYCISLIIQDISCKAGTLFSFFLDGQETIDVNLNLTQPSTVGVCNSISISLLSLFPSFSLFLIISFSFIQQALPQQHFSSGPLSHRTSSSTVALRTSRTMALSLFPETPGTLKVLLLIHLLIPLPPLYLLSLSHVTLFSFFLLQAM